MLIQVGLCAEQVAAIHILELLTDRQPLVAHCEVHEPQYASCGDKHHDHQQQQYRPDLSADGRQEFHGC
jgi:hypothetical protein